MTTVSFVQQWDYPLVSIRVADIPDFNATMMGETLSIERLPSEPIGSATVILTNVVSGSRYRIERQSDGSLATPSDIAAGVAASSAITLTLDLFLAGNPNNDITIKVRNASGSPAYKPFQTLATLTSTSQSIYIGQQLDE